jgi:hypothetical protein
MAIAFIASFVWLIRGLQTNNASLNVAFIQSEQGFSIRDEAATTEPVAGRTDVPIGTLAPALVISGAVIAIGALASRRTGKNG